MTIQIIPINISNEIFYSDGQRKNISGERICSENERIIISNGRIYPECRIINISNEILYPDGGRKNISNRIIYSEDRRKDISSLSHLKESANAHKKVLIKSGMKQADLDEMDTLISSLTESENKQEDSKHVRTTHLMEMNAIVKEINKTMFIIRKAAAIAFQDQPEILQQFKPVTRKKSSAKTETTTETITSEAGTNG